MIIIKEPATTVRSFFNALVGSDFIYDELKEFCEEAWEKIIRLKLKAWLLKKNIVCVKKTNKNMKYANLELIRFWKKLKCSRKE